MRKRLAPPSFAADPSPSVPPSAPGPAPVATVMGDAAREAAYERVAGELARARADGRLVVDLPLDGIVADHLVRDRIGVLPEEMNALIASLAARGQQTPIEVEALEDGRYGLISGWRRLVALRQLGVATANALIRRPETTAGAYLAMVEENEIRAGIGHYERARIAARAAARGVFDSPAAAVDALFPRASKAKRSKIRSFLKVHDALDAALAFPSALPERTGLALAGALDRDGTLAGRLAARLRAAAPADARAEEAILRDALAASKPRSGRAGARADLTERQAPQGVRLLVGTKRIELRGAAVDETLARDLAAWLHHRLRP